MEAHKPLTIEEIEASMRPGKLSLVGFLGTEERLAEVLELDDETVRSMSLTHDQISDKMIYYSNLRLNLFKTKTQRFIKGDYDPSASEDYLVLDEGHLFGRPEVGFFGFQECPWRDGAMGIGDEHFVNVAKNKVLFYSDLIPHLIKVHHFYEGFKSPFRVDPKSAAEAFDLI